MANRIEVIEYLKTYVRDEVGETRPYIDADNIDWIAEGIVKLFSIHHVSSRTYFFECWDNTGKLSNKEIQATCEEHAILKFEKRYEDVYGYNPPYVS